MISRSHDAARRYAKKRLVVIVAGGVAGVAFGLAAIYGMNAVARNAGTVGSCKAALQTAQRVAPFARGEVAAFNAATAALRVPELTFRDAQGQDRKLSEWHGRSVLLNLWATWCVPCRKEMPALEALQRKLGSPGFEVVAVNIDTRAPEKPKAWLKEVGITQLAYYADPEAKVFQDLRGVGRAFGMPTTLLLDPDGCEVGTLAGPAEWASDDAVKLVQAALGQ